MIDRRTLLKSASMLALPAPGSIAVGGSNPIAPAPHGKVAETGILKLRFRVGYAAGEGNSERIQYFTHVWICPPGAWKTLPGSNDAGPVSDDELDRPVSADDTDWSAQLLEDGRVVAVRLEIRDGFKRRSYPRDEPEPEAIAALRRIRSAILGALEDDDRVTGISLNCGGNGDGWLNVSVSDGAKRKGRHFDREFYIRMSHEEED